MEPSESTPARAIVAAFDLDGTLVEGGSVFKWLRALAGSRRAYGAAARLAIPLGLGALRSGPGTDAAKERLFVALLAGREEGAVRAASARFIEGHFRARRRDDVLERLARHVELGHHVVVVSASPQFYVDLVAARLGAKGAIGTRLAVDAHGRLTGRYDGANCRGEAKVERLRDWIAEHVAGPIETYGYGNSRGDRRLLESVDHPVNVGRLGRAGALRTYPTLAGVPL